MGMERKHENKVLGEGRERERRKTRLSEGRKRELAAVLGFGRLGEEENV